MKILYVIILVPFLLVGCSTTQTEPRAEEPMLTPIEDLGFSHEVEEDDSEWNDLEKVHAKLTAQWYVDPNVPLPEPRGPGARIIGGPRGQGGGQNRPARAAN
jgi:hypothetical protein